MQKQRLSRIVQFQIDSRVSLDVECDLLRVAPDGVPAAVLPVAQWPEIVDITYGIVFLPELLERHAFPGESLVDLLLIERPVKFRFGGNTGFPVEKIVDEFVGDIFRKRVCQFVAFPETFQEIVDCRFPTATTCCYGTTAETVHVVKPQYFLVVY